LNEEPFAIEPLTLAFVSAVCAQDLRCVMGVDALGESLEELGELPGDLVLEFGEVQDQTRPGGHVVGGLGGI
jgi:hypothetical protein